MQEDAVVSAASPLFPVMADRWMPKVTIGSFIASPGHVVITPRPVRSAFWRRTSLRRTLGLVLTILAGRSSRRLPSALVLATSRRRSSACSRDVMIKRTVLSSGAFPLFGILMTVTFLDRWALEPWSSILAGHP